MKKLLLTLGTLLLLSGCATFGDNLENRLACSVAKDELYMVSKYGPVGISTQISEKDRAVVCK